MALLVRLYALVFAPRYGFVIDEAEYYQIASILSDGRGWMFYDAATWVRPPLYLIFLAGIFKFFGPNLILVKLLQIGLGTASVYLVYRLGVKAFNRKTGLVAGLLAAVAWPFAVLSYLILSETLFIFLFLLAITLLMEYLARANLVTVTTKGWKKLLPQGRSQWAFLITGGICLGLAALTRGQVLSFVPFIGLWLWLALKRDWWRALGAFAVVVALFVVTIAPWALRNYSTYGRAFIDTTGGYNFYLGALTGRNGALVSQTLEAVKNQSERELLGYQKGLEYVLANPDKFISKGFKESVDFWQINFGGDERLEKGYTKGLISAAWLIPDALFGDLLYILVGALALIGLLVAPATSRGVKSFTVIWIGYNMALAFAFFAVSRFRLPVYFFMFLFAAYTLANWREVRDWFSRPLPFGKNKSQALRYAAGLILPVLFLLVVVFSYDEKQGIVLAYDPGQSVLGITKWFQQQHAAEGDKLRREGRYNEALAEYAKADHNNNPFTEIGTGLTEALMGRYDDAIGRIGRTSQDISQSHLALGWIYLQQGNREYARSEFNTRQVSLDSFSDEWAWDNLPAAPLPANYLELGEFDWGYTSGFQGFEKDKDNGKSVFFRWTADRGEDGNGRAKLRFPAAAKNQPKTVELRLRGFRPDNLNPPIVEVWANGRSLGKVQTNRDWQTYKLNLPPDLVTSPDGEILIELGAPTFVPGADSRRELGVMVEWAKLS